MNYHRWNKLLLTFLPLTFSSIVIFNYIIDPYFVFNTIQIDGINKIKNNTMNDHMSKFYAAKRSNAKVLLAGTSRTEHINPIYLNKYVTGSIFNLSLPGSSIAIQKNSIKYFIEKHNITTIVLGLDFFAFNPVNIDSNTNIVGTRYADDYLKDYLDSLLSIKTLIKSVKTISDNIKRKPNVMNYSNGWRTYVNDYIQINKYGDSYIEKQIEKQIKAYSSKKYNFNYSPFKKPYSVNKSFIELEKIIQLCKDNNVKLYMFISPIYSEITDLIYSRGYGVTYDYWKKELSKYKNIYDFSGYNSITLNVSNYVDGSHYQTTIAALMFAKIFNDKSVDVPADFGTILNNKNIDIILNKQNKRAKISDSTDS